MNIGVDIDGVLTDLERMMLDYGTKLCVEENWPVEIQAIQYDEQETFNWPEEQAYKFWNTYFVKYITESAPRAFAPEIIEKLQQEGNKIYLITARDDYGMPEEYLGKMQELTRQWLQKNNINYEKLIFAKDKEKLQQCFDNDIDVMIEDSPNNIQYMSEKIKVIKFDCQYNKNVNNENIITAYSWYHIYQIIKEMKGE